jgi:hypothetical protein
MQFLALGIDSLLVDDLPAIVAVGRSEGFVSGRRFNAGVLYNSAPTDDAVAVGLTHAATAVT